MVSSAIYNFGRKISGKGVVRAGKRFTLFISNEDINDIIKIMNSFKDSGVWIDGVTETVKHDLNKQEDGFLGALLAPLSSNFLSNKGISERGVRRAGRGYVDKNF